MSLRQTWSKFVSVGLLCVFSAGHEALAQETINPSVLEPNLLVEQMLRAVPEGGRVVEVTGYVGPSEPDVIRIY
jgi:hypothetical protein